MTNKERVEEIRGYCIHVDCRDIVLSGLFERSQFEKIEWMLSYIDQLEAEVKHWKAQHGNAHRLLADDAAYYQAEIKRLEEEIHTRADAYHYKYGLVEEQKNTLLKELAKQSSMRTDIKYAGSLPPDMTLAVIKNTTIEECAKVADKRAKETMNNLVRSTAEGIANQIRALKGGNDET